MMDMILRLSGGIGRGQPNDENDVFATDNALREIGAYAPPPEYAAEPQRYATEPMIGALERFQEQNGLKIDGYAKAGGPTERAINNNLLGKPRGAGLLDDLDTTVGNSVGNGFQNEPGDVSTVKRALGGLGYLLEDPFDKPSGFIEESTTSAIKRFQEDNGLTADGWLAPRGETEAAIQRQVDRLAHLKRPEWLEYRRRAPSAEALQRIGALGDPSESARLFQQMFESMSPKADGESWVRPLQAPTPQHASEHQPSASDPASNDPEANFGRGAIRSPDPSPEGFTPPDNPLKPDVLGGVPLEGMGEDDLGTNHRRDIRRIISRIYRVGGRDEDGKHTLSDEDFDAYLASARQVIKDEHYPAFELTARAVRAGVIDSQTAATRLAAYYAPATTSETIRDVLLDFAPGVSQIKSAIEASEAIDEARDAARYGDESAYNAAIGKAALAIAALILPGAGPAAKKIARALGQELHHLIPRYLGGRWNGPLLPLTAAEHRESANALHLLMQRFFAENYPKLVHGSNRSGKLIRANVNVRDRLDALDACYRSLQKSESAYLRETYETWLKIFPEAKRYIRR